MSSYELGSGVMPMEQRETRQTNRFKLTPEACTDGPFKGYVGLDRINFAATRGSADKFSHLMHHLNEFNLRQAFRQCDGAKAVGSDQVTKYDYGLDLQTNLEKLEDEIRKGGWRPRPSREKAHPQTNWWDETTGDWLPRRQDRARPLRENPRSHLRANFPQTQLWLQARQISTPSNRKSVSRD